MFIYSVRATTIKFFALMFAGIIALTALILFIPMTDRLSGELAVDAAETIIKYDGADTADGRIKFLEQFGWSVSAEHISEQKVTIPDEFDNVFCGYNEIQIKQGLDLGKYKRKEMMRYTYEVTNYPDYDGKVLANLLVYRGKVVAGDICSEAQVGFIHGFERPVASDTTETANAAEP